MPRFERAPPPGVNPQEVLARGTLEVMGQLPFSSNYVFLVKATLGSEEVLGVYKPTRGERPLWDFPHGTLAAREVAAFRVSEELGWGLVPPTVLVPSGPLGEGSVQMFVDHDPERHYFTLVEERRAEMLRFAAFDVVINNADRKGGHIVEGSDGRLWGVDHGLSFNVEPKLRTVVWAFAGDPVPDDVKRDLTQLASALEGEPGPPNSLDGLLAEAEIEETRARARLLAEDGMFPVPSGPFSMPWPLV